MAAAMFLGKTRNAHKTGKAAQFLRLGQYMMNCLYEERPDLHERICGTDIDPFYDDARIPAFETFLYTNW